MINPDAMYRHTLDRQHQLLDEAARIRLASDAAVGARQTAVDRPWRARCAAILRRVADRIEPAAQQSQVHA